MLTTACWLHAGTTSGPGWGSLGHMQTVRVGLKNGMMMAVEIRGAPLTQWDTDVREGAASSASAARARGDQCGSVRSSEL